MKNKLTTNLGLKLISVLFSIVLWLVGTSIGNPTTSKSFYNVPVVLENTDAITESGRVYEVLENSDVISRVTIRGPRSVVSSMSESNIVATADVSNISSLDTVSIKLATNINQDQINSITPSSDTVKLNIENKKTKTMALGTKISGEVSDGYMVGDITTDQNLVRISGPESVVTSVSKAVAEITVTGFTSDISTSAEIRLYDADGNAVDDPNITQNIKSVNVQVSILQTKEVPLVFHTQGEPTYGYGFTGNVECDLQTVTICGKSSVLKKIQSIDIPAELLDENTKYYINPTGRFVVGGPQGDTGLTGRKIIVDTYGGYARHGGGAFSGKDPSKVDRSAAYATRWVAKNIVAAGLAKQCEVQVAYAIGVAKPVSIMVDTFGTGTVSDEKIEQAVEKVFDLTPAAIIRDLDLRKPIYRKLAAYGHMGREDLGVKWENTDRVDALKAAVAAL